MMSYLPHNSAMNELMPVKVSLTFDTVNRTSSVRTSANVKRDEEPLFILLDQEVKTSILTQNV